jgi:glucose-6-phosphate 1-epimerase
VNSASKLQEIFGIAGKVTVTEEAPDYPIIQIDNQFAKASIALHGAQVITFQPKGHDPVLWLSGDAIYAEGVPIRGGIPICWPWFGEHAGGTLPAHGFVRKRFWQLESIEQISSGATRVIMSSCDDVKSRSLWDHAFKLQLTALVGLDLSLSLEMTNCGVATYEITTALHSYFYVGDISMADVGGFDNVEYIDQLGGDQRQFQNGAIRFDGELDRIYQQTLPEEVIHDKALQREISLRKTGSRSTVVWNPWARKADSMEDFERGGYRHMLCVETSNAGDDIIHLAPGGSHRLGVVISVRETCE